MSSINKELLLHVGLPKTATTTIQRELFACHPEVYYLGKIVNKSNKTRKFCLDKITYQILENILWELKKPLKKDNIRNLLKTKLLPTVSPEQVIVGSWEGLGNRSIENHTEMLTRAKNIFGGCRIMITLRNPINQIPSEYIQNLHGHFIKRNKIWLGLNTFVDIENWYSKREKFIGRVSPLLNYSDCIRTSIELLGKENVGVFLFEDLQNNPSEYYRSICNFMNIDSDVGIALTEQKHLHGRISQRQIDYLCDIQSSIIIRLYLFFQSTKFRRNKFKAHKGGTSAKAILTEGLIEKVSKESRQGHRWLVENFDLPLEQYGYPL